MADKEKEILAHVNESKTGQKTVTIPKKSNIEEGDLVKIIKVRVVEE